MMQALLCVSCVVIKFWKLIGQTQHSWRKDRIRSYSCVMLHLMALKEAHHFHNSTHLRNARPCVILWTSLYYLFNANLSVQFLVNPSIYSSIHPHSSPSIRLSIHSFTNPSIYPSNHSYIHWMMTDLFIQLLQWQVEILHYLQLMQYGYPNQKRYVYTMCNSGYCFSSL